MALLGVFDRRKVTHWLAVGLFGAVMFLTGLMWMAVRTDYRQDFESQAFAASREARLERIAGLTSQWLRQDFKRVFDDLDVFVDRMWVIYYPALAVSRVPSMVPHENGAIMWRALLHIVTPRLLFPDKAVLESDSEMVLHYSGVWAAGADQDTSIAFGYAAESYVDFGVPLMFGLTYFFTEQIKAITADVHRAERWLGLAGLLALAVVLIVGGWRWYRRVGRERLDAGPPGGHSPPP